MKEKINLQELTVLLSRKSGISKKEADTFLREFFGLMIEALIEDKAVKVKNIGTFKLLKVEARESVDVRNGNRVVIPAHTKVSYTQANGLSEIINKPYQHLGPIIIAKKSQKEQSDEPAEEQKQEQAVKPVHIVPPVTLDKDSSKSDKVQPQLIKFKKKKLPAEVTQGKRKGLITVLFTFLIVAALITGFYLLSKETGDTINYRPSSSIGTVITGKEVWESGKIRKTKVGDRLTLISFEEYGDVVFWIYIYEENKHLISKDNYVRAGVDIIIPPSEKYDIDAGNSKSLQKARDFAKNYEELGDR